MAVNARRNLFLKINAESNSKQEKNNASNSFAKQFLYDNNTHHQDQDKSFEQTSSYSSLFLRPDTENTFQEQKEAKAEEDSAVEYKKANKELLRQLQTKRENTETAILKLSKKAVKQLSSNFQELSLIEGNLLEMDRNLVTLYCTSCFHNEGKTVAAVNTAFGLSVYGKRDVLLIDSNFDNPQIHRFFGIHNEHGLQDILNNSLKAESTILPTSYEHLFVLPAGQGQISIQGLIFQNLLEYFKDNFDYVIIDGQALLSSSVVTGLAQLMDCFLLVVECEKTKWEVVQLAREKLTKAGSSHIGIVLNKRKYYIPKSIYRLISKR